MQRLLLAAALCLALVAGAVAGSGFWAWRQLDVPLRLEAPVRFELAPGASLGAVARDLDRRGLLASPRIWRLWGRLSGRAESLRVGEYLIEDGATPRSILERFVAGDVVRYRLRFVEGWRFSDYRHALASAEGLAQDGADLTDEAIMVRLGAAGMHPEGRFFPDTYSYERGTSDLEILARARTRMEEVLADVWSVRSPLLPFSTPEEALILASLVEKETGSDADRALIAGVFTRRLERGMRLQTDPSVIYGLGDSFDGDLTRRDLRTDHPYNTYLRGGLPPTPIAMPGRASLEAAVLPAETDALYFVARGDGSSQFSATLEEHEAAVRRFQIEGRAADYRSAPAPDTP